MPAATTYSPTSTRFDQHLDGILSNLEEHQKSGKKTNPAVLRMALELQGYAYQQFSWINQQQSHQKLEEANKSNVDASKTFGKKSVVWISVLSAAASIAGGSFGVSSAFFSKKAKLLKSLSNGLGAIGNGFQTVASIPNGMGERDRTLHQYFTNLFVEVLREQRRLMEQCGQKALQSVSQINSFDDKLHQGIRAMAAPAA